MKSAWQGILLVSGVVILLSLMACGDASTSPVISKPSYLRRAYVNDYSQNEQFTRDITSGLLIALHPGGSYSMAIAGSQRSGDQLYIQIHPSFESWKSIKGTNINGQQVFNFDFSGSDHGLYVATWLGPYGQRVNEPVESVRWTGSGSAIEHNFSVHLYLLGKLSGLELQKQRDTFVQVFLNKLIEIYASYGITINGNVLQSRLGDSTKAISLNFPSDQYSDLLPNNPTSLAIPLVLVEKITNGYDSAGTAGIILGFSPREAIDPNDRKRSRVILSNLGRSQNNLVGANELAVTAAHELGHYFGLRHTTASEIDILSDSHFDNSNIDDGFTDTPSCSPAVAQAFSKSSIQSLKKSLDISNSKKGTEIYFPDDFCLRIASPSSVCSNCAETKNLMYADYCGVQQVDLSPTQIKVLLANLSLLGLGQ